MNNKNSNDLDVNVSLASTNNSSVKQGSSSLIFRICKFPLRAILGLEPIWKVIVVGGALLFLTYEMVILTGKYFLQIHPVPEYALQVTYVPMAIYVLVQLWSLIALWQAASRLKMLFANVAIKIVVALVVLTISPGDWNAVHVLQTSLSAPQSVFQQSH